MLQSLDNFTLNGEQMNMLEKYSLLMQKWNARIQMTATRDPKDFISRHVVDSLELARELQTKEGRMLDVGSGGGLPGIILAIALPCLELTLIEPTKKKQAFLAAAKRELSLANLQSFAIRDEELRRRPDFVPYDFAVARAVWSLPLWLERGKALVRSGGTVFGMEGREASELPGGATRRRYGLDGGRSRAIVTWIKPADSGDCQS